MKIFKRLVAVLIVLLITIATLSGCRRENSEAALFLFDNSAKLNSIPDDIEVIENSLVYYKDTKVVYIMITLDSNFNSDTASYFAPYISENGKYCRYIDGNIVEIE